MAMRDQILEAIKKGGATKESLLELTGTTEKGLASQLTYLRMTGSYPVKGEDGVYSLTTAEEWEARKATTGVGGKPLTPAERLEKAEKRSKRAASAYDNAKAKKEANPEDRVAYLNFIKAEAELEISEINLGRAQAEVNEAPEAPETVDEETVETDVEVEDIDDEIDEFDGNETDEFDEDEFEEDID